jgi:hypothetical protein
MKGKWLRRGLRTAVLAALLAGLGFGLRQFRQTRAEAIFWCWSDAAES